MGCDYSLVGHSERRKIFKETDVDINHALAFVQQHGVTPILCVGESKEEYELGLNEEICVLQLRKDLKELTPEQVSYRCHCCIFSPRITRGIRIGCYTRDTLRFTLLFPPPPFHDLKYSPFS